MTAPEDLAKEAESARAAMNAASVTPVEPSSAPSAAPPPLVPQPFKAAAPSAACNPVKIAGCALDVVDGAPATDLVTVKRSSSPNLIGWAAEAETVPPVVIVELVGPKKKFFAPATRATKRPDVAAANHAPALVDSGYDLIGVLSDVEPGTYAVHLIQVGASGNSTECDSRRQLKVE